MMAMLMKNSQLSNGASLGDRMLFCGELARAKMAVKRYMERIKV